MMGGFNFFFGTKDLAFFILLERFLMKEIIVIAGVPRDAAIFHMQDLVSDLA